MNDPVNHPKHYTSDPSGIECIEITRHRNFNIGNAIKYLWRAGLKDGNSDIQDLQRRFGIYKMRLGDCKMRNLIKEWGLWSRHNGYEKHDTPLLAFMRANGAVSFGSYNEPNISDDEALAVDKAVCELRREFLVLYNVLFMYHVWGWSYRQISRRYLTPLEYPHQVDMADSDSRKRFVSTRTIGRLLQEAERQVYQNIKKRS